MSEDEIAVVMATIDEDGGGDIDLGEFTNWFLGLDTKKEDEKISKIGTSFSRWCHRTHVQSRCIGEF